MMTLLAAILVVIAVVAALAITAVAIIGAAVALWFIATAAYRATERPEGT